MKKLILAIIAILFIVIEANGQNVNIHCKPGYLTSRDTTTHYLVKL